jgi:predicted nucleic acid-binding protein
MKWMIWQSGWSSKVSCDDRQRYEYPQLTCRCKRTSPVERGRSYLEVLTTAMAAGEIPVLELTEAEHTLVTTLPRKLGMGECEAIALCQERQLPLLTNDRRAVRYCQTNGIDVVDLPTVLRLFWTRQVATRSEVEQIISRMEQVERLILNTEQRAAIFAPQRHRG